MELLLQRQLRENSFILHQNKMTIAAILTAQIGTQPLLTASPAGYPLIKAAEMVAKKL